MKDLELKEKNTGKVFTKKKASNTINKNHTSLKVNYKIIYERNELHMKKQKNGVVEKLIISKDDFKEYFNKRKTISREEYYEYIKHKNGIKNSRLIPDLVFNNYKYL